MFDSKKQADGFEKMAYELGARCQSIDIMK